MQFILVFVVLVFSVAIVLYALPLIIYIAPLIVVAVVISLLMDSYRHRAKAVRH